MPRAFDELAPRIADVARERRLDLAIVFGSQATGKTHARSDLDIAVRQVERALSFSEIVELTTALASIVGADVDVVDVRRADPLLLRTIFEAPRVLHAEAGALFDARLHAFHLYEDYRPFLRLERESSVEHCGGAMALSILSSSFERRA